MCQESSGYMFANGRDKVGVDICEVVLDICVWHLVSKDNITAWIHCNFEAQKIRSMTAEC